MTTPGSRWVGAWPMVAAAALVLASMAAALAPGRTFYHRDLGTIFHPLIAEARHRADGAVEMIPAWTHATASGRPILENPGYALLSPGSLLWLLFPHETAFDLFLVLHAMAAAAGMAFLALRLGASREAALAAGACLGLGAGVVSAHDLYWSLVAIGFAPWVIAAGIAACEKPAPRRFALLALALGLQADGGMPEVVLATLLLGGVLSLVVAPGAPLRRIVRVALTWGISGIWGIALAAPQLVPAAMNAERTLRGQGIPLDIVLMNSLDPRALPGLFIPRWGGSPMQHLVPGAYPGGAWGDGGLPYLITWYCGAVFLILGVAGILLSLRAGPPRRRAILLALASVAALGAILALGRHFGPVRAMIAALPAPPFRFPIKALFATFLAMPLLAAFGLDALRERFPALRTLRPLALGVVLLGALELAWAHHGFMPAMSVEGLAEPPLVEVLRRRASELSVPEGQWFLHHHRSQRAEWGPPGGSLPPDDLAYHQWQRRMLFSPSGVPFGVRYALERQGDMLEDRCAFELAREIYGLDPAGWAHELGGLGILFLVSFDGTLEQQRGGALVLERALGEDVGVPAGSGFLYRDTAFRPRLDIEGGEARVASFTDDHHGMTVRVDATTEARLVVREIVGNRTCWRATAGDRELPMERWNRCLAAITVPAGDTTIRLQRTPPFWHASLAACGIALLGVVAAVAFGRRVP